MTAEEYLHQEVEVWEQLGHGGLFHKWLLEAGQPFDKVVKVKGVRIAI